MEEKNESDKAENENAFHIVIRNVVKYGNVFGHHVEKPSVRESDSPCISEHGGGQTTACIGVTNKPKKPKNLVGVWPYR